MMRELITRVRGPMGERPADQIRAEVHLELDHHLECLREELVGDGTAAEELDAKIAARFGDAQRFAAECTRIAMKERIMLQRINLALLILLGLAVGWSAWGTAQASARSADALDKLTKRIEELGNARRPAPSVASPGHMGPDAGTVMVTGKGTVGRPGAYAQSGDPFTLRRVLIGAAFSEDHWTSSTPIKVLRLGEGDRNEVVFSLSKEEYAQRDGKDFVLRPGDLVQAP